MASSIRRAARAATAFWRQPGQLAADELARVVEPSRQVIDERPERDELRARVGHRGRGERQQLVDGGAAFAEPAGCARGRSRLDEQPGTPRSRGLVARRGQQAQGSGEPVRRRRRRVPGGGVPGRGQHRDRFLVAGGRALLDVVRPGLRRRARRRERSRGPGVRADQPARPRAGADGIPDDRVPEPEGAWHRGRDDHAGGDEPVQCGPEVRIGQVGDPGG